MFDTMALKLPNFLTPTSGARSLNENADCNFMGVVTAVRDMQRTLRGEYHRTFTIQDDLIGPFDSFAGLNVKIFRKHAKLFEQFPSVGDVVIVHKASIRHWNETVTAVISSASYYRLLILPAKAIPVPELSQPIESGAQGIAYIGAPPAPTIQEQMYAIHLRHAAVPFLSIPAEVEGRKAIAGGGNFQTDRPGFRKRQLALIQDLKPNSFYDFRGEVVKVFHHYDKFDLYVTDYTENKQLYNYEATAQPTHDAESHGRDGDPFAYAPQKDIHRGWQGPSGQKTLLVRLFGAHAAWAQSNVHEGDFVFLQNLRTKMSPANWLEGVLHEDQKYPEKVGVSKLSSSDIKEIRARKRLYETPGRPLTIGYAGEVKPTGKQARGARKREAKKMRELAKAEELKAVQKKHEEKTSARAGTNGQIRCVHPEVQLVTLAQIVENARRENKTPGGMDTTLPFVCAKYRARVRVVDFKPDKLEDFARPVGDPSYDDLNSDSDSSEWDGTPKSWEWAFALLVEDVQPPGSKSQPTRMRVLVANDSAEYLLKMDASDLRIRRQALDDLKEKLFYLWGNLEELKAVKVPLPLAPSDSRKLTNKPFECCLEEYGHFDPRIHDDERSSQRLLRMWGTTIMD